MIDSLLAVAIGAVVGGAGFVGLIFYFIRRYIDNKLNDRDRDTKKRREQQIRRLKIEYEMEQATGRLLFWMFKAIDTGHHNGDFREAWTKYRTAEEKKKELNREVLVDHELK